VSHDAEQATARERILGVAGDLFAEGGFDAVSVADIASASGISTGLIYYHFKDKQTLFETVVRESIHLLEDAAVVSLSGETGPEVRLTSFVTAYMKLLEEHESLMRLLIRSMSDLGSPLPRHVLMRSAAIVERLQAVIEEGIASGVFRAVDARLAATALFALINTLITARVLDTPLGEHGGADIEAQASFMSDLFMGGIRSCS
jgi:AcrR family transcriptional regulator